MFGLQDLLAGLLGGRLGSEFKATFQSLRNRNFRVYAIGQWVSLCGTYMQNVALSWVTYKLTGSATDLGLVSFASSLPVLLLMYFGGTIADRYDRRKILIATQYLDMAQALALVCLAYNNALTVTWLVVLGALLGCVSAVEMPTRLAFVPGLVKKSELINAIGLNSAMNNASRMVGPLLAALLLGLFSNTICFVFNLLSYIAAVVTLGMIHTASLSESPQESSAKGSPGAQPEQPVSVWSTISTDRVLRNVLCLLFVASIFGFQYMMLLPVIAKDILNGQASLLGILTAASAVGALTGSLSLANRGESKNLWLIIGLGALGVSVGTITLALSKSTVLSMIAVAATGLATNLQFAGGSSLVQFKVDPSIRGRMMSIYSIMMIGVSPFASLASGWCAERFGVEPTLIVTALVLGVAAIAYLLRTRDSSPAGEAPSEQLV